ncbi:MAG TPA: DUF488 family protein [Acidimicrobiales bacterium]|nr:DUF488 family protein [Acidimicrobiales bacterium]
MTTRKATTPKATAPKATTPKASGFELQRVYDHAPEEKGYRVLVDRLWPRGIKKEEASLDDWDKDVAPSTELRRWYGHEPSRFAEFKSRYRQELRHAPGGEAVDKPRTIGRRRRVILLTATRDVEHSAARVLLDLLDRKSEKR